jgi:anti-anti-sigma factor
MRSHRRTLKNKAPFIKTISRSLLKKILRIRGGTSAPFIDKIENEKNVQVIRLKGDVDMATIPGIGKRVQEAKENRGLMKKDILLDFEKVDHVDSATIAGLLVMLSDLKHENHQLALINVPARLKSMIKILECRDLFSVYPTEKKARQALLIKKQNSLSAGRYNS